MTSETSTLSKQPGEGPAAAASAAGTKPRKRSKWDQPAEHFASATVPLAINGAVSVSMPGLAPVTNSSLIIPVPPTSALPQPKVQDEVIAREIVINDAEPSVRCKLTKRQTQEEIEKSTGAIVITRGKYRPPNALPDGEKPLYLHVSASSHIKDVIERIKAVDKAASIVEDILKQGKVVQPFTACVFLGFEADPSLNVSSRIRGPNDQFINHIVNETGASVVLRGRDSENSSSDAEESSQPLHLFLSSANAKNLDSARILAENLLDTIAAECGATRLHSSSVFSVIPPTPLPPSTIAVTVPVITGVPPKPVPVLPPPQVYFPQATTPVPPPTAQPYFTNPVPKSGTHYNGYYEGLYPQATPLQQVALALKQANPAISSATASIPIAAAAAPAPAPAPALAPASSVDTSIASMSSSSSSSVETNKRATQKRKFQELPVPISKGSTANQQNSQQQSGFYKSGLEESNSNLNKVDLSKMPPPRKLVALPTNETAASHSNAMMTFPPLPPKFAMPPPPPKFAMPPPPPKFSSIKPPLAFEKSESSSSKPDSSLSPPTKPAAETLQAEHTSETLLKLVEYGEEDDDDEANEAEVSLASNQTLRSGPKPFWAV